MTIKKLIEKYNAIIKDGYESISLHEVVRDLKGCQRIRKPKVDQNNCAHYFVDNGDIFRCKKCKFLKFFSNK